MPRVAILCEYSTLSGGERSMLATLPGLRERGFELRVLSPEGPLADAVAATGVVHQPIRLTDGSGDRNSLDAARESLGAALGNEPVDLVHANSLAMGRIVGPVARALRLPSLSHLRDIVGVSAAGVRDLNCHRRLLAVSEATRRFHIEQGLDAEKTHVMYNGVDLQAFQPRQASGRLHRELSLPGDALLVGAMGQVSLRKGLDVFLAACERLAPQIPRACFVIVGTRYSTKAESVELERRLHTAANGSLAGRLHLLGERSNVHLLLSELTILLHTSRQEPLGRVLLEAAAAGLAIVATNVGGTREIFPIDVEAAKLVPPDDVGAIVAAVSGLLSDDQRRRRLGEAARRRAETTFGIETAVAALAGHYQAVLAGTGPMC